MARAFVIRPFETHPDSSGTKIDFDRTHRELIQPALSESGYGQHETTTGQIVEAGNIRKDMFLLILEADLVICDITINNANVFYELGIRHALRQKHTVLIRGDTTADQTPFDLLTDRYLKYDLENPSRSKDELVRVIEETKRSARETDSPIFEFIRNLPESALAARREAHPAFDQEVARAKGARAEGWLRLLAGEVSELRFRHKGMRVAGRAQWELRDHTGALDTWERIRDEDRDDIEANLVLAEIYGDQYARTGHPDLRQRSEEAIARVLDSGVAGRRDRARALTRRGHNEKTQWHRDLPRKVTAPERREVAVNRSIVQAYEIYRSAFLEDPAEMPSALAAFQMGSLLLNLSSETAWPLAFDDDERADSYRRSLENDVGIFRHLLKSLLGMRRSEPGDLEKVVIGIARAELLLLCGEREGRVLNAYQNAIPRHFSGAHWEPVRRQLQIYSDLTIPQADRVIETVDKVIDTMGARFSDRGTEGEPHIVLVSGSHLSKHPAGHGEERTRQLIEAGLQSLLKREPRLEGFAAAAPGAEIIFHEVCKRLGIRSTICLPVPAADYAREMFSGLDEWRSRFLDLQTSRSTQPSSVLELSSRADVPDWLYGADVDPWERGSRWLLKMAQGRSSGDVTLLLVRDGAVGQAAGAGSALEKLARDSGTVRIVPLDLDAAGPPGGVGGRSGSG